MFQKKAFCSQILSEIALIACCLIVLSFSGCDDSIHANAPFHARMVIYSILNSESDSQFVRIYSTYNPRGNDPFNHPDEQTVTDATVLVTGPTETYSFQFKTIPRPDSSRYKSPIGVYVAHPFRPLPDEEYILLVSSPTMGEATAKTRVPGNGYINCLTVNELYSQHLPLYFGKSIRALFSLNDRGKAQVVRFYLVYTTESNSQEQAYEVPLVWKVVDPNREIHQKVYDAPTLRTSPLSQRGQNMTQEKTYEFPTYNESLYDIVHNNVNARFKRAVFKLIQFDNEWYRYYATIGLFQDRLGVRVERPEYTNIQGGWGVFGSLRVDSAVIQLPELLYPYPPGSSR